MDGNEFRFDKNERVKLRDISDPEFYGGMAVFGNEGWIVKRRRDRFGMPEVYVKWDTNHWTYNGVEDCWTFQEHFDRVEVDMDTPSRKSRNDKIRELSAMFGEQLLDLMEGEGPTDPGDAPPDESPAREQEKNRDDAVNALMEKLRDTESFVVIGVRRDPDPRAKRGVLTPWVAGFNSDNIDADALLAAQAAVWATKGHEALVLHVLHQLHDE